MVPGRLDQSCAPKHIQGNVRPTDMSRGVAGEHSEVQQCERSPARSASGDTDGGGAGSRRVSCGRGGDSGARARAAGARWRARLDGA